MWVCAFEWIKDMSLRNVENFTLFHILFSNYSINKGEYFISFVECTILYYIVILWYSIDSSKYSQNDTKIFAAWWTSSAIKNHHLFLKYSTEGWLIYFHELVLNLICPSVLYLASMVSVFKNPNVWMIASKNTLKFKQDKNISYPEPVIRFLAE